MGFKGKKKGGENTSLQAITFAHGVGQGALQMIVEREQTRASIMANVTNLASSCQPSCVQNSNILVHYKFSFRNLLLLHLNTSHAQR